MTDSSATEPLSLASLASAQPPAAPQEPAASLTSTPASPAGTTAPAPSEAAPSFPNWLPANLREEKAFNELLARDAAEQSRRATLPTDPKAYKVELPKDFKVPEGFKFQLNEGDPLWDQGKAWAHKHGQSQDAFNEAVALVAGDRIAIQQKFETAARAELAELGPTAKARLDSVETFLTAQVGEGPAKELMGSFFRASNIKAMEKLISSFSRGGAQPFSTGGREPPTANGRVSDEEFARMPAADRLNYARSFDQRQFSKPNGRAT